METIRLLLIEDDAGLLKSLARGFGFMDGYKVFTASDGETGYSAFLTDKPDIIVSDIAMPGMNGIELARKIRETDTRIPFILLTGYTDSKLTKDGYNAGIDEYMLKPVVTTELDLHIRAILKRIKPVIQEVCPYEIGSYTFDHERFSLIYNNVEVKLSGIEMRVLRVLCRNMEKIVKRKDILKEVWKSDDRYKSNNLDVYVSRLRKLLSQDPSIEIVTVKREGLKLSVFPNSS
ncbi:MAG: response regulator transcription factor [Tannerella sp.]|jgi:DNA-binding response OmpR family regulator|nr:response regulator transcription factor [Tannerella sp.]